VTDKPYFVMFLFKTTQPRPMLDPEGKVKFFHTSDEARDFMISNHANQEYETHCIGKPGVF